MQLYAGKASIKGEYMFGIKKLFSNRKSKMYRPLGRRYREKPVEPWAYIRVKNEMRTFPSCLESILPAVSRGVIGCHRLAEGEADDGTIEYAENFCKEHPGFIFYFYDHPILPAMHPAYFAMEKPAREHCLDSFYNAVLQQIPEDEWLVKIDADHIYDSEKLAAMLYLPKSQEEYITISRLNLHYEEGRYIC